jgi:hypothetical protein
MKRFAIAVVLAVAACGGSGTEKPKIPHDASLQVGINGQMTEHPFACVGRIDTRDWTAVFMCRESVEIGAQWDVLGPIQYHAVSPDQTELSIRIWSTGHPAENQNPDLAIALDSDKTGRAAVLTPFSDGMGVTGVTVAWTDEP